LSANQLGALAAGELGTRDMHAMTREWILEMVAFCRKRFPSAVAITANRRLGRTAALAPRPTSQVARWR
jgi:hypothetical protein